MDSIERLRFLAPGTGEREGGEKTQPFNRFHSHPGTLLFSPSFQNWSLVLMEHENPSSGVSRQMVVCQNWLGNWARWWNISNPGQPNPCPRPSLSLSITDTLTPCLVNRLPRVVGLYVLWSGGPDAAAALRVDLLRRDHSHCPGRALHLVGFTISSFLPYYWMEEHRNSSDR